MVEFRVTVALGQDSVDPDVLHTRAATVHDHLAGNINGATVAVDPVKATVQLIVTVDTADALTAAQRALAVTGRALHDAGSQRRSPSSPPKPKRYRPRRQRQPVGAPTGAQGVGGRPGRCLTEAPAGAGDPPARSRSGARRLSAPAAQLSRRGRRRPRGGRW